MDTQLKKRLEACLVDNKQRESKLESSTRTWLSYGTAGFRGEASKVGHVFFRVGLISGLRCMQMGANIGIMITASHNPIQDNGVKLIDPEGDMLASEWESIVEEAGNMVDVKDLLDYIEKIASQFNINTSDCCKGRVFLGMDTRPSSEALAVLVKKGLETWTPLLKYHDYGLLTTPALHFLVAESNRIGVNQITPTTYYNMLLHLPEIFNSNQEKKLYKPEQLVIDCANGVGYETMRYLMSKDSFKHSLPLELINTGEGILNKLSGADYVKSTMKPPVNANSIGKRYAALDGDADRLVYFYLTPSAGDGNDLQLRLLDGDKIMALLAIFVKEKLDEAKLLDCFSLGLIQTAYANGASTDFMRNNLNLQVDCVDTGVKNLHKQALKYDVAIYFEANGHGTILLSQKIREAIDSTECIPLKELMSILNSYTGDAISDVLMVETILRYYDWDIDKFYNLYQDKCNSLIKIQVPDKNLIKTIDAGRVCSSPDGLQEVINSKISQFGAGCRSFVRPSGTEDVVRVYAEASDPESAEMLANLVADAVQKFLTSLQT